MAQPLNPPANPVPGAIYTEDLTGISWVWTGVSWIEAGGSGGYNSQVKTGMALTPGFYTGLSSRGDNLSTIATHYGTTAPTNPAFGKIWVDTTDPLRPITYVWTDPGSWTKFSDGVGNTFIQATTPTGMEYGDTWFNSSTSELSIWDGSLWKPVAGAGGGGIAIGIQTYPSAPVVQAEGYVYYNTTTDKLYISDGAAWVEIEMGAVDTNSILAITQPSVRANGDALQAGDIWINPSLGSLNFYNGSSWTQISSSSAGNSHVFLQSAAPGTRPDGSSLAPGDIWVDSDDSHAYYWNSTSWFPVESPTDNNTNSIVSATAPLQRPTAGDPNLQPGDLWVNTTDFTLYYWTGLTWASVKAVPASGFDTHSFSGITTPVLINRPDSSALQVGDQYVNTATNTLYYWNGSAWGTLGDAGPDYQESVIPASATQLAGFPTLPSGGGTLKAGDIFHSLSTERSYYYTGTTWKPNGTHNFISDSSPNLAETFDGDTWSAPATSSFYVRYNNAGSPVWVQIV